MISSFRHLYNTYVVYYNNVQLSSLHTHRFNRTSSLLRMSYAQLKPDQLRRGVWWLLKLLSMLHGNWCGGELGWDVSEQLDADQLVILWVGPQREDGLMTIILAIQVWQLLLPSRLPSLPLPLSYLFAYSLSLSLSLSLSPSWPPFMYLMFLQVFFIFLFVMD